MEGDGEVKVQFIIPGKPMGKQRARTLKTGRSYTPKETVNYETLVKLAYSQLENKKYFEGPLKVYITAYFSIPTSTSKGKTNLMMSGKMRPTKKPDMSNIIKIIEDALNGIAYKDDCQIVEVVADKFYSTMPRVEVELWEVMEYGNA